jgi:regulator of RNase E activity RraA
MTLYCWDLETYNSVSTLTEANATDTVVMTKGSNLYVGAYEGIAAKQIDETVFVAGVYTSGGVRYSSPVISYSLGAYCKDQIANGSDTMKAFAAETAVYGFYAKAYFASLEG